MGIAPDAEWDEAERQLFVELAIQLVEVAHRRIEGPDSFTWSGPIPFTPNCFDHGYQTSFENLADVLESLGFGEAYPRSDDPHQVPPLCRLTVSPEEARERLLSEYPNKFVSLERMLGVWVDQVGSYRGLDILLPTTREPFTMPDPFAHLVPLFARLGYLRNRDGLEYVWTDRIGQPMVQALLWDYSSQHDVRVNARLFKRRTVKSWLTDWWSGYSS